MIRQRPKRMSLSTLLLLGLLSVWVLAGCSAGKVMAQIERAAAEARDAGTVGRVLVLDIDGHIYTVDPDGRNRIAITGEAADDLQHLQPTWSPDGERLAWTQIEIDAEGDVVSRLVTSRVDGSGAAAIDVPFTPFYIYWSPDSSRLAYLSSWLDRNLPSMALRLVEIESPAGTFELTDKTLAQGQPFYFSWAPDGQRILTHVGDERLALRTIDGAEEPLLELTGSFPAPQWASDGKRLVYSRIDEEGRQRLVVGGLNGEVLADVTDYDRRVAFTLDPAGERLAYAVTDAPVTTAALGPLYVVDLATLGTREVSAAPVLAFFWSPDGSRLAYLAPEEVAGEFRLRPYVWDGRRSQGYPPFLPSRTFLQSYLTYFDQYAQSMTIWSPDSAAFVYAGSADGGTPGIWVQRLGEEAAERIGSGVYAAWSPR